MNQSQTQLARLGKLVEQSKKFLTRLRATGEKRYSAPPLNGQVYRVAAGDALGWDDFAKMPAVYLVATDSDRVHVALVPREMAGDVPDYRDEHRLLDSMPAWLDAPGVDVTLNARYLREAIHPAADAVTLRAPERADGAALVASLRDGKQIALAIVAPLRSKWRGSTFETVWPPAFISPADKPPAAGSEPAPPGA